MPEACAKRFLPSDNAAREEPPSLPPFPVSSPPPLLYMLVVTFCINAPNFQCCVQQERKRERERDAQCVEWNMDRGEGEQGGGGGVCLR